MKRLRVYDKLENNTYKIRKKDGKLIIEYKFNGRVRDMDGFENKTEAAWYAENKAFIAGSKAAEVWARIVVARRIIAGKTIRLSLAGLELNLKVFGIVPDPENLLRQNQKLWPSIAEGRVQEVYYWPDGQIREDTIYDPTPPPIYKRKRRGRTEPAGNL